jgi:predicted HicB family RNase H-like nuclease
MTTTETTTAVSDTAKNAARRGRPYCGEREALTVRLPTKEAAKLRRQAEARGVTLNQVATEVMRAGLAR